VKALIVGGNRFLGHELALRLVAAGHAVTVFNRGTLADALGDRVERLRGDRTTADFERLLAGRRFDAVVDFAAFDADAGRRAARVLGGRVGHYVAISTGQVYLVRQGCPRPARESDYDGPLVPRPEDAYDRGQWDYGVGKRGLEDELARAWEDERFPATRLRIPMVNGERDHFRRIERYLWRLLDGGPLLLPGGGAHQTRQVYSGAVVKAILGLLGNPRTFGRAYNLAQDETPTLRELLTALATSLGAAPRLVEVSPAAAREAGLDPLVLSPFSGSWMSFVDPGLAQAELGFRHEPLAAYLDKIVAAFLAHPPAEAPPGYEQRETERRLAAASGAAPV
jgi:nucleoside-diphosphate-sugar epimerase